MKSLEIYNKIEAISPYENIEPKTEYPFVYLIAGMNDYRCPMWQIAKFVTKFRKRTQNAPNTKIDEEFKDSFANKSNIIVRVDNDSSHYGNANLEQ